MGKVSTRWAGIAGIIFVLLIAVPGFASGAPPDTADPAAKFLSYFQTNRSGILVATFFGGLANIPVVFFVGGLLVALRRLGAAPALLIAALTGLILTGGLASVGGLLNAAAAFRLDGAQHVDAESIRMLSDASALAFTLLSFTTAAFLLPLALMLASVRRFPTWLAWVAGVGAILELAVAPSMFRNSGGYALNGAVGLLGLIGIAVPMLATAIVMVIRGQAIDAAPAT